MALDIFSKPKKQNETLPPTRITIDNRERNSLVPSELVKIGCSIDFKQLEIGDYICGDTIVERKTVQDLQASIIDKRIFAQLEALSQQESCLLIIEGDLEEWGLHENVYRGFILTLTRKKTPFILTKSFKDTARFLVLLSQDKPKGKFSLRPYRKIDNKEELSSYILEGFPGIGPATAEKLINKFKSIKNIINAPEEELKKILGLKYDKFKESIN